MTTDLHAYEAVCVQGGGCFLLLLTHLLEATHFLQQCDHTCIYVYIYTYIWCAIYMYTLMLTGSGCICVYSNLVGTIYWVYIWV